ncbi:MAG TPA: sugar phosphate nucleotidyltransferase [Nitrososphaera sp.]|nr:sugar phosphate nucleotidyltransferase [Nitrososphaera sp.]
MAMKRWYDELVDRTQVIVVAGGKAKRLGMDVPKCLLEISGKKLIDMSIESLANDGFRDFVLMLGHKAEMVMDHVGDGSKYGVNITYSVDPAEAIGWGKGKAFKHALVNKKINTTKRSLVVFPDDIVLEDKIFSRLLMHHAESMRKHATSATIVLVPGTEYPYGVANVDGNGIVMKFTEKPLVNVATSIGMYAFEPDTYDIIRDKISLEEARPIEFESIVLPQLASENKLSSMFIETKNWVPINTLKEYENAIKVLSVKK